MAIVEVEDGNPRYPYKPPVPLTVMINPSLEPVGGETIEINEGCLSVPDLRGSLPRHLAVRVRYLDREGEEQEEVKQGLTAGTFQHEVDHLDGVLFVDRADPRTFATWEQFDRHQRDEFVQRVAGAQRRGGIVSAERATALWCELAWLGGERAEAGVLIELDGDRIGSVETGVASPPPEATALPGLTIPGLANAHSHAFQRALRGRTQAGPGDFWTWRQRMYALAETIDPESCLALARATFGEMALAGITAVGEFHYLHHGPGGARYEDPNELGKTMIAAAREAGIRITLLDTCYLDGGIGRQAEGAQLRFSDGSADAWAERVAELEPDTTRDSVPRSTASGPSIARPPLGSRSSPPSDPGHCTPTSPSSRPRTRTAPPPTA